MLVCVKGFQTCKAEVSLKDFFAVRRRNYLFRPLGQTSHQSESQNHLPHLFSGIPGFRGQRGGGGGATQWPCLDSSFTPFQVLATGQPSAEAPSGGEGAVVGGERMFASDVTAARG